MTERPRPGWVRGSELPTADVLNEISRLSKENAYLREELAKHNEDRKISQVINLLERRTLSETSELNMSLLSFFRTVGRELTVERRPDSVAETLSEHLMEYEQAQAILDNHNAVLVWLKELAIFDLVESRTDRFRNANGGQTESAWWRLTSFGKKTLATMMINSEKDG